MYCSNCGKETADGSKVCSYCGTGLPEMEEHGEEPENGMKPSGGNRLKKCLAGVILALAVCILLSRLLPGGTVYRITDYLLLQQRGINGSGEADIVFDREAFLTAVSEEKDLGERDREQIVSALTELEKDCVLSKSDGLSNGDEIKVTSHVDKKLLRDFAIRLKNGTKDVIIDGFAEELSIPVNDYLQFSFYGFDGYGYSSVQIDWDGIYQVIAGQAQLIDPDATETVLRERGIYSAVNSLSFQPSYLDTLSNGDEISVEVSMNQPEIAEYAIVFSCESLKGTVEGLVEPETICISDYLSCVCEGYDGAGTVKTRVDEEKLKNDLRTRYEEAGRGVYGALTEDEDLEAGLDALVSAVSGSFSSFFQIEISSDGTLKNGDEITVTCSLTDKENPVYLETFGLYLETGTWKTIVSGLNEPEVIDLSEALTLNVEGVCPQVQISGTPDYELDYLDDLNQEDISFHRTVMLQNGETYTGTIGYDEDALLRRGYKVSGNSYTVSVEGLNTYYLTLNSAADERILPMKDILMDGIRSELDSDFSDLINELGNETGWVQWHQLQPEFAAAQVVYDSGEDYFRNCLYLAGKVTVPVKRVDQTIDQKECYVLQSFYNVEETPAGDLVFDQDHTGMDVYSGDAALEELIRTAAEDMGENLEFAPLLFNESRDEDIEGDDEQDDDDEGSDRAAITDKLQETESSFAEPSVRTYDQEAAGDSVCGLEQVVCIGSSGYLLLDTGSEGTDCYGNTHSDWHRFDAAESAESVWYLNGDYQTFSASVICNENVRMTGEALNLEILLDGERALLIENDTIYQGPQEILLNVEEKRIMEIKTWANDPDTRSGELFLTDTGLMRAKEQSTDTSGDENVLLLPKTIRDQAAASAAYQGSVYYRFDQPMTWKQAKSFCESQGGRIAFAKDEARSYILETLMKDGGCESYWLAAYREQRKMDWEDGSFPSYEIWNPEEAMNIPDNAPGMSPFGEWKGYDDEVLRGVILELVQDGNGSRQESIYLCDKWVNTDRIENVTDSMGMTHYGSCLFNTDKSLWIKDELNGMYTRFVANLSWSEDSDTDAGGRFAVFGDGRLLYELSDYTKDREPIAIDVDLTGVNTLKIATDNDGTGSSGVFCLNEARLILTDEPAASSAAEIDDLIILDETGIDRDDDLFTDAYETLHDGYCRLDLNESVRGIYNLEGAYHIIRGTLTAAADTAMDAPVRLILEGDGQVLCETDEFTKRGGMLFFEADVTGVNDLEISAEVSAGSDSNVVYLTDLIIE